MNETAKGRRTLLQSGLALLGGGLAVAAGTRWGRAQAEAVPAGRGPLKLYARIRPIPGVGNGNTPADTRVVASGQLFDAPDGKHVGEFSTNCFCLSTPFGPHTTAASNVEMQVLQLHDGTLFGMSAPAAPGAPKVHAIVGGTARFAGARGTYIQQPAVSPSKTRDLVEFIITVTE
ncbi:MAG TPA: hypothetical protein VEL51_06365 [Vicinamibacterales bacterium]|nr:hypothetical protein [Vicinamibacterales bacterium]